MLKVVKLLWKIWWWQFRYKDEWTPEITDKFDWFVNIRSIQDELLVWTWFGSFINWEKPFEDVNENKCDPSNAFMSLHHHEEDLALKSPVTTDKRGLRLFMALKRFSKLDKNNSDWLLFWLGER